MEVIKNNAKSKDEKFFIGLIEQDNLNIKFKVTESTVKSIDYRCSSKESG